MLRTLLLVDTPLDSLSTLNNDFSPIAHDLLLLVGHVYIHRWRSESSFLYVVQYFTHDGL